MPKKKKTKKSKNKSFLWEEQKKWIIWVILIFISVLSLFPDTKSVFWYYFFDTLVSLFWEYYKIIFSPVLFLLWLRLIIKKDSSFSFNTIIWLFFYFISLCSIFYIILWNNYSGVLNLASFLDVYFGAWTSFLFFLIFFYISLVILFRVNIFVFFKQVPELFDWFKSHISDWELKNKDIKVSKKHKKKINSLELERQKLENEILKLKKEKEISKKQTNQLSINDAPKKIKIEKVNKSSKKSIFWNLLWWSVKEWKNDNRNKSIETKNFWKWNLPGLDLLKKIWWDIKIDEDSIIEKSYNIKSKLKQFKIEVDMQDYRVWPTVVQYRLKPKDWVKLNKIENLKKDITLALKAKSIRIQAPIPWEWVVWIEIPNDDRQSVGLREVIESREFNNHKVSIPIAMWKDVNWDLVVWDLTKMPHLLIAGQTWSGKSVGMNGFLVSILYKFSPDELKMIMIDPKMVELSVYNGIPHLLTPVITNADKATNSLKWAVAEMLRRYELAKTAWARNLKEYNNKVWKKEKLPYIVIVIDELADLMMSSNKKEVESSIARIAQMARAVWMHLIVATQRPSVDVITWLIKANIPSRIAFTVASQVDSQTILWKKWAEDLLGRWDMLYYPTWAMSSERVQWVYVDTDEVESVVNEIKRTIDPSMLESIYDSSIVNWKSNLDWSIMEGYSWDADEDPKIIEKAILVVKEAKKWSTSLVQRKLWLGYARAAKVLDILEELWVVWPANGSKPRDVLVD